MPALYKRIYCPNHPKSKKNGCVYEHVLNAENKIGRYLKNSEVVHHINSNKKDNRECNLIVFASQSDHLRFHHNGICLFNDEGVAYSPEEKTEFEGCFNNIRQDSKIPPKEELFELIHKYSFVKIGRIYGVSDNTIRKWCKKYQFPYMYKDLLGSK